MDESSSQHTLTELESPGLVEKMPCVTGYNDCHRVRACAWFGPHPAPCLWEEEA